MITADTRMGIGPEAFPDTAWSSSLWSVNATSTQRQARLDALCAAYWRPVYAYIRAAWNRSVEDAKDLTQEFFCRILAADLLADYRPEKGRFRDFLKGALRHFLTKSHRDNRTQKRGSGRPPLSLDVEALETSSFLADLRYHSPEELFDLQWARDILADSIAALRDQLTQDGKQIYFGVYESYELHPSTPNRPTYEEVAARLRISTVSMQNYLQYARARLRELVVGRIARYVSSYDELHLEMDALFDR
jgi:RNA polymerase sigma-70 factor (ECF subfamily)